MKTIFFWLFITFLAQISLAQTSPSSYEVEVYRNEGKDTREFNSILTFGDQSFKMVSSRDGTVYKEIKYTDIKAVEISYSPKPKYKSEIAQAILVSLDPHYWAKKSNIRWLTVLTGNDFAVLKLEKDNHRLIKAEFGIRKIQVEVIVKD
jgi:hypothetical protein